MVPPPPLEYARTDPRRPPSRRFARVTFAVLVVSASAAALEFVLASRVRDHAAYEAFVTQSNVISPLVVGCWLAGVALAIVGRKTRRLSRAALWCALAIAALTFLTVFFEPSTRR